MTSKELLKYILREVYGVEPNFHYYSLKEGDLPANPKALLAIGDDALKFLHSKRFPFVYDLAEEWFNITGLPFVFALWAVRRDSYQEKREEVLDFYERLKKSREIGENSFNEICSEYSKRLKLSEGLCRKYLETLNFHLGEEELQALREFAKRIGRDFKPKFIEAEASA